MATLFCQAPDKCPLISNGAKPWPHLLQNEVFDFYSVGCPGLHTVRLDTWQVYRGHTRATAFFKGSTRGDCPPVTIGSSLVQLKRLPESAFSGRQIWTLPFLHEALMDHMACATTLLIYSVKANQSQGLGRDSKG